MNIQSKNICILPVKSNSIRLRSKNFLQLGTKPLWRWTLDSAIESGKFDLIVISTDSPSLFGEFVLPSNVKIYNRDKSLCKSSVHASKVLIDVCHNIQPALTPRSAIFMALVTSPFRNSSTFTSAVNLCNEENKSVVGVTKASKGSNSYRLKDPNTGLVMTPRSDSLNRQSTDIDEYIVTGSVFVSPYEKLEKYESFHQPDSLFLELNEFESLDINSELDFNFAQFLVDKNFSSES